MATWAAQITDKSEVTSAGVMTYSFSILKDGEAVNGTITVEGKPEDIQQMISDKITTFASAYELAADLPDVGEVLNIIE